MDLVCGKKFFYHNEKDKLLHMREDDIRSFFW